MSGQWSANDRAERIERRLQTQLADGLDGWRHKGTGKFERRKQPDGHHAWDGDRVVFTPSKSKNRK